jgi:cytochrome P450
MTLPVLTQSPVEPGFVQNPYAFYERARSFGPVVYWQDYGKACVVSHSAVNAVLRDRRWGREVPPEDVVPTPPHIQPFMDVEAHSMLELEPPRHTRLRGLVMRAFSTKAIRRVDPFIAELANSLIDGFSGGDINLLTAFAEKIPVLTIARMLGVPPDMADQLLDWSHRMVGMYQANRDRAIEDAAAKASGEFAAYIGGFIDERRRMPDDDLITALIAAEEDGQKLSRPELVSTCILLLNAGHEATVHAIGNGVKTLLESGRDPAALVQPGAIDGTVEETLRFDPPLHMFDRYACTDIDIGGHSFHRGDKVALLLAAANRDPAAFAEPDRFDPARDAGKQLAFGAGTHFCVGTGLAKLEIKRAFETLFKRLPDLRMTETPAYADCYHFHGLNRLMVTG